VSSACGGHHDSSWSLALVFFPTPRVSLEAVPRVLVSAGTNSNDAFTSVDRGFSVGVNYTF
jgi:hypothetical protein